MKKEKERGEKRRDEIIKEKDGGKREGRNEG